MYDQLSIRSDVGIIQSDSPVVFVPIEARVLVFAPEIGQTLEAAVARHGSDHLALLVHGLINVTIPHAHAVDSGGPPTPGVNAGIDPPAVGATVRFIVRALHVSDGLLTVLGELAESEAADIRR